MSAQTAREPALARAPAPRAMSVGRLHQLTLTGTPMLATLAVVNGSALLGAMGGALMLALLLGARSLHDTVRSRVRTVLVHAVTALVLVWVLSRFRQLQIDGVLITAMLGIFDRFLLRGGHRDDFLVVGASSVLLAAATTITPGVTFLLILVAYVPLLLWALWTAMILGTAEADADDPAKKELAVRALARRPAPKQAAFIAWSGLGLMAAGYAAVSLLPRYTFAGMLAAGAFMPLPGASSSMELTSTGAETLDDSTVVLRVEPGPKTEPASLQGLYARVYVLDELDGRTFKSSGDPALFPLRVQPDRSFADERTEAELGPDDEPGTVRVTLARLTRDQLQHPLVTLGRTGPSEVVRRHARQTMSGTWISPPFRGSVLTYKVHVGTGVELRPLPRHLLERQAAVLKAVPDTIDPRIVELGQRLTAGKTTTRDRVNAILVFLSQGFTYSLEPLAGTSPDPLARFLFEAKRGHCELYAGALAVLLRVSGESARVVTGYYNGAWNEPGGYLAFTQQDAHAWVEVFDEGQWRWVDATPEDLRAVRKPSFSAFLRDWWDAAEAYWFDHVVDFDETKRRALIGEVAERVTGAGEAIGAWLGGGEGERASAGRSSPVLFGALLALVGLGLGLEVVRRIRGRRRRPDVLGLRLRRALGAGPAENLTLGALLERVPGPVAAEARRVVALYEALRFGPPGEAPRADELATALAGLERSLRGARGRASSRRDRGTAQTT